MVSYPDSSDGRSLTIRRPPSVMSSRTATSRHHRHRSHRSHAGGSSYAPQNEFPVFTYTGDVEIVLKSEDGSREQRYLLHRLILAQCSGFFEAGTSEEWSKATTEPAAAPAASAAAAASGSASSAMIRAGDAVSSGGQRKRWRYELDWGSGDDDVPLLVQKPAEAPSIFGGDTAPRPPPVRNKPAPPQSGFFRSMANFSTLRVNHQQQPSNTDDPFDETLSDYDNLLRIFYNYPPTLDTVNIAVAYVQCKSLLQLADMYDALEVIGPRVDHHLLRFSGRLFKQIAKYPPSYLKLGYLARSKAIFAEALIHVVGQWPMGAAQLEKQIPEPVMDLILDKVDELDELKSKIEGKLFRLTLTTSRGERVGPSNSFLDWLAMSLFRQWLAENTTPLPASILKEPSPNINGRNSHSSSSRQASISSTSARRSQQPQPPAPQPPSPSASNTGRIFRMLGAGGSAYLTHDDAKKFLKLSPELYTRENLKRFERRLDEVKNLARDVVRPLMRNFLELELGGREGGGLPYLTCTRVEERDFPWEE